MKIQELSSVHFCRRLKRKEEAGYINVLNQGRDKCIEGNPQGKKTILIVPATSLPNKTGAGNLNTPESLEFFDFAKKYWGINEIQILPVGQYPVYQGIYPFYSGTSMDLGSQIINIQAYINKKDFNEIIENNKIKDRVNFANIIGENSAQEKILKNLYKSGMYQKEFEVFKNQNQQRLEPKALYKALSKINRTYNYKNWNKVDKNLFNREIVNENTFKQRVKEILAQEGEEMDFYYFKQFLAEDSLKKARENLNQKGLKLDGDMLCGFSGDEVWAHPKAFIPDTSIGWSLPAPDLDSKAGQNLLREKVKFFAERFDGIRIDASWTYVNQPQIKNGSIKRKDYADRILNIIDDEIKKVKGDNSRIIMHEFAANPADFNIFDNKEIKPYLKDRIKIYTSDYLHENWGTNRNFLERGWAPESFIIGARNHDSGKMEYSEEQASVLSKILKINTPKTQKEFVKAKLAEPMDAKYSMIYFADALNIDKPFQGNSDRTLDYATLIPEDYQNRYFASLERGEGYNPMDALEKQFKAKGLDRTEPKLYRKIVKYKKILEQKEKQTNQILKAVCGIICACLLLYGAAKYHKNRSHDLFH